MRTTLAVLIPMGTARTAHPFHLTGAHEKVGKVDG